MLGSTRPERAQTAPTASGLRCYIFVPPGSCGEQNTIGGLKCQHCAFLA